MTKTQSSTATIGRDDGKGASSEPPGSDPRPLGGYAKLLALYSSASVALVLALRRRKVPKFSPMDLILYALATEHLSRVMTKDSITSVIRAPFTTYEGPAGEGEVNEKVVGHGTRHAAGEMLTCPFCAAQWIATALFAGSVGAPRLTRAVVTISATARLSDYLQFVYAAAKNAVE